MLSITSRPGEICFSRDPIIYTFHTDLPSTTEGLMIEVAIYFCPGAGTDFTKVYTQPIYPDINGDMALYVGEIVNSMLTYSLPSLAVEAITDMNSQVGRFYIDYREITTATPTPAWLSDSASTCNVIKGGTSYERWQGGNFFSGYMTSAKPFLTWQTSGRLCGSVERMYLYYLHMTSVTSGVTVKVRVVYTDGTEASSQPLVFPAGKKYHVYQIPSGPQQLALAAPAGKMIHYYEVSVMAGSTVLAAPFRYEIDNRPAYSPLQLNYINSLGGIDSIRLLGVSEPGISREAVIAERVTTGVNNSEVKARLLNSSISLTGTWTGNSGFVTKNEHDGYLDIFASRGIYRELSGRWLPLVLTSQKVPLPKSTDDLFSITVEFQAGFTNTSWTPAGQNF
ncbi:hypothetical protein [Chitinophaga ginsengisegetis]|uniref:hypothetical protein n=1 Tax=Chitinophaga ginsengisegetis TaxID=393003 RepID=UPI000DB8F8A4|nr:hypothetical protein [Chitinophaga ginsengisegetis]MDR6565455.1 hypothetical protein [Chitinophaga ginsengisegetis]MDR6645183.1 hypothetical protein [Chitinophaga ginsengisegetis]MDR6652225.1 hypothetical protein [Chitinophaga ginsengisegetis]